MVAKLAMPRGIDKEKFLVHMSRWVIDGSIFRGSSLRSNRQRHLDREWGLRGAGLDMTFLFELFGVIS